MSRIYENFNMVSHQSGYFENILHDMKSPVSIIYSSAQLIEESKKFAPETGKYLSGIKSQCRTMLRLINDAYNSVTLSRKPDRPFTNCNIVEHVENIVDVSRPLAESKGISLIFDTNTEEKTIATNKGDIERIILNIISNSIKFTPPGGSIMVSLSDLGASVKISVKDTGLGVESDSIPFIFDRHEGFATESESGYGIGLSIVRDLVQGLGGVIEAKHASEFSGLEIVFELPVFTVTQPRDEENVIQGFIDEITDIRKG